MVAAYPGSRAARGVAAPAERPTVSVVICTYSSERWQALVDAVGSVRRQAAPPLEVIVVVDHNPELLARAQRALAPALVVANPGEPGESGSRNVSAPGAVGGGLPRPEADTAVPTRLHSPEGVVQNEACQT